MTRQELFNNIIKKKSYLCIGLDTDITKIPKHLLHYKDPVFEFNKQIIDATKDFCVAYKPNLAFYESLGGKGLESMKKTVGYIPSNIFTIADAKRGDIGNTSALYAKAYFEYFNFDAITVAPYMGKDSVTPFLQFKNKWVILLALTSNKGAEDFQHGTWKIENGKWLFQQVMEISQKWGNVDNMMFVVGATHATMLKEIRQVVSEHFLLIPGVGAQGGSLQEVSKYGMNKQCGLLVNSSRNIIYASRENDFADKARAEAKKLQQEMENYLEQYIGKNLKTEDKDF